MLGDWTAFASLVFVLFFYSKSSESFPPPGAEHALWPLVLAGMVLMIASSVLPLSLPERARDGRGHRPCAEVAPMAKSERQDEQEFGGEITSLFRITVGPVLWSADFLLSYGFCANWGRDAKTFLLHRMSAGALTFAVLASIARFGWRSWQQWDWKNDETPANDASQENGRHQILGHAILPAINPFPGTNHVALPFVFIESCR